VFASSSHNLSASASDSPPISRAAISAVASPLGGQDTVKPPECPPRSKKPVVLQAGTTPDGQAPLYWRACGAARATVTFQEKTYRADGGFCTLGMYREPTPKGATHFLSPAIGLITNGTPVAMGFSLIMDVRKPVPAGPVRVVDSVVQVHGRKIDGIGTAVLRKHGKAGSFWLMTHAGDPNAEEQVVTSNWTCHFKKT
jgi:hypothetical protein